MAHSPKPESPAKMRVVELRAELEKRGLPSGGLKKDLIARLEGAIAAESAESEPSTPKPETVHPEASLDDALPEERETPSKRSTRKRKATHEEPDVTEEVQVAETVEKDADPEVEQKVQEKAPSPKRVREASPSRSPQKPQSLSPALEPNEIIESMKVDTADVVQSKANSPERAAPPDDAEMTESVGAEEISSVIAEIGDAEVSEVADEIRELAQESVEQAAEIIETFTATDNMEQSFSVAESSGSNRSDEVMPVAVKEGSHNFDMLDLEVLNTVVINNLTRPYTPNDLKSLLKTHGELASDVWTNSIKSRCVATFTSPKAAELCRDAINGTKWPSATGRTLAVQVMTRAHAEEIIEKESSSANSSRRNSQVNLNVSGRGRPRGGGIMGIFARATSAAVQSTATVTVPPVVQQQAAIYSGRNSLATENYSKGKDPEPPASPITDIPLDSLFKKTKTRPHLYYRPHTEAEIKAREIKQ